MLMDFWKNIDFNTGLGGGLFGPIHLIVYCEESLKLLHINGNKYTPNTILNGWCQKILILKS